MTKYLSFTLSLPFVLFTLLRNISIAKTVRFIRFCFEYIIAVYLYRKNSFPPVVLISVTGKCNLSCEVCFINQKSENQSLSVSDINNLYLEATENSVKLISLTGGEPFTQYETIKLIKKFQSLYYFIFTNSINISQSIAHELSEIENIVLLIGVDGPENLTEARRGMGIPEKIEEKMDLLKKYRIPFGVSVMVTSNNIKDVTDHQWINYLKLCGCSFILFVPYTPAGKGFDLNLILNQKEIEYLGQKEIDIQYQHHLITLSMHWLSSTCPFHRGRGLYITENGELGICPALPFSKIFYNSNELVNIYNKAIFLKELYSRQKQITTCIFRSNPEIIVELIEKHNACSKWNVESFNKLKFRSTIKNI